MGITTKATRQMVTTIRAKETKRVETITIAVKELKQGKQMTKAIWQHKILQIINNHLPTIQILLWCGFLLL